MTTPESVILTSAPIRIEIEKNQHHLPEFSEWKWAYVTLFVGELEVFQFQIESRRRPDGWMSNMRTTRKDHAVDNKPRINTGGSYSTTGMSTIETFVQRLKLMGVYNDTIRDLLIDMGWGDFVDLQPPLETE